MSAGVLLDENSDSLYTWFPSCIIYRRYVRRVILIGYLLFHPYHIQMSLSPTDLICQVDLVRREVIGRFSDVKSAAVSLATIDSKYKKHAAESIKDCLCGDRLQAWGWTWLYESKLPANPSDYARYEKKATRVKQQRGTFTCRGCMKELPLADGHDLSICRVCETRRKQDWVNKVSGRLHIFIAGAKNRTKLIGERRRWDPEQLVTYEQLQTKFQVQRGLCAYSGLSLSSASGTNWQMSLERLDDNIGYTNDNTALTCLEFNVSAKWTSGKVKSVVKLRFAVVNFDWLVQQVRDSLAGTFHRSRFTHYNIQYREENCVRQRTCPWCEQWKPIDSFVMGRNECRDCSRAQRTEFGHFMSRLFHTASTNNRGLICSLTLSELHQKVLDQKGRCYYSKIPLVFSSYVDWHASLERLDVSQGYTDANTVLICYEFNSGVFVQTTEGSTQWSGEKFDTLVQHLRSNSFRL